MYTLNGQEQEFIEAFALTQLLENLGYAKDAQGIAIAVNQHVVPRRLWETTFVQKHDAIDVVVATQGG